jgi:type III pantothenate kinase
MNLLIDLGNSRLKWAQHAQDLWLTGTVPLDGEKNIESLCHQAWGKMAKPGQVILCSVSSPARSAALENWMRSTWSVEPVIIRSQAEQLGVKNLYRRPEQLGADRWAALIGARGLTVSAACVVDAGTAVTVDALSGKGEFLGGAIFPGLKLLRDSLVRGTVAITADSGNISDGPGRSTEDGVAVGTLIGLAGAVEYLVSEYRQTLGHEMKIFLTGGDASVLSTRLRVPTIPVPDLVLTGLRRIADSLCG